MYIKVKIGITITMFKDFLSESRNEYENINLNKFLKKIYN